MRHALVLAAAVLLTPLTLRAADPPPITFQTHPLDRVLNDLRAAADLVGGEKAVKAVNASIKEKLGEKGFEGLDITKPVVGYVVLAPKFEDTVAVVAFPVSTEKEFLGFCERWNGGAKPKDLGKGLYEVPPLFPELKGRMRFADGYAYVAAGKKPDGALDEKALVPVAKLYDPGEKAVLAGKLHFDRIPAEVKKAIPLWLATVKKDIEDDLGNAGPFGVIGRIAKAALPDLEKMIARYLVLLGGADTLALRVGIDVPTSDLAVEATLTPKPNTLLAKAVADRKPTTNKFADLLTPDTAFGFKTRLPFFNDELRAAATKALEEGQKAIPAGGGKDLTDELFKGLIRTVKTGEFDVVGGVRGPDKDGEFTLVAGVAFEDTAALEKEFRKYVTDSAPADEVDRFKWDAAKADKVNIHTYKPPTGGFIDITKPFGGEKALAAFAFAPKGVLLVLGPDPIPVMKTALAVKPVDAPVLDVVLNPARVVKFVEKVGGTAGETEKQLGKEDKLVSATSLRVTGGKDLTVKYAINLRLLPRLYYSAESADGLSKDPPEKK